MLHWPARDGKLTGTADHQPRLTIAWLHVWSLWIPTVPHSATSDGCVAQVVINYFCLFEAGVSLFVL